MSEEKVTTKEQEKQDGKAAVMAVAMKRKGILLIATFILLIALVIAGTAAWYTKVANVSGITMKVAEFDFNANFQSDNFMVHAFDYTQTEDFEIAPGAGGVIPINVTSSGSGVDVNYTVALNFSDMAPEFKERIIYYYLTDDNNDGVYEKNIINPGNTSDGINGRLDPAHDEKTEYLYWEWVYELTPKLYYDPNTNNGEWVVDNTVTQNADGTWQFANSAARNRYKNAVCVQSAITGETPTDIYDAEKKHDELDTQIGLQKYNAVFTSSAIDPVTHTAPRVFEEQVVTMTSIVMSGNTPIKWGNPEQVTISAIQQAMEVRIMITGGQAKPMYNAEEPAVGHEGTSKFVQWQSLYAE